MHGMVNDDMYSASPPHPHLTPGWHDLGLGDDNRETGETGVHRESARLSSAGSGTSYDTAAESWTTAGPAGGQVGIF